MVKQIKELLAMPATITKEKKVQKITINVPVTLLKEAREVTGKDITKTVCEGLEVLAKSKVYKQLAQLHGSCNLKTDINTLREDREI